MNIILTWILLVSSVCYALGDQKEFLSLRKELFKISADFELKYSVRELEIKTGVNSPKKPSIDSNFEVSIIKIGDQFKIVALNSSISPSVELLSVCYDGEMFYSFLKQHKTLYVGTDASRFDPEINGYLKYCPAFILLADEHLYGKSLAGPTAQEKIFEFNDSSDGKSIIKLSESNTDLKIEGLDFRIPKEVVVTTSYKGIVNPMFSFTSSMTSFNLQAAKDYSHNSFKISAAEAIRIIDCDSDIEIKK